MRVGNLTATHIDDTEYYMRLEQLPKYHLLHTVAAEGGYGLDVRKSSYNRKLCWFFKIEAITHYRDSTAIKPQGDYYGIRIIVGHDIQIGVE